jgi:hypothetical protein
MNDRSWFVKKNVWGYLIILFLFSCSPKLHLRGSDKNLYPISSELPKDQKIVEYYTPYKTKVDSLLNNIVAVSAIEITKARPEGPLNNLMADAMSAAGKLRGISFDITVVCAFPFPRAIFLWLKYTS